MTAKLLPKYAKRYSPDPVDENEPPPNLIRLIGPRTGKPEYVFQASDGRFYDWPSGELA